MIRRMRTDVVLNVATINCAIQSVVAIRQWPGHASRKRIAHFNPIAKDAVIAAIMVDDMSASARGFVE